MTSQCLKSLQILEHVLEAKQTLLAFQTLLANKDWVGACEGLEHAAHMHATKQVPGLRCFATFAEEIVSCKEQLRVDLLHALQESAMFPAISEVTNFAAGVLKV
jgi:hypothetical protein